MWLLCGACIPLAFSEEYHLGEAQMIPSWLPKGFQEQKLRLVLEGNLPLKGCTAQTRRWEGIKFAEGTSQGQ